jgi:transposase
MLVNALRAHLAEFGIVAPQGLRNVGKLIAIIRDEEDARLPDLARQSSPFLPGRSSSSRQRLRLSRSS